MDGVALLGLIAFMGGLTSIVAIIARSVLRYQDRKLRGGGDAGEPALRAELDEVRAQLVEQHDVRQRLVELEERMDFAERLLTRQGEAGKLAKGGES